MDARQSFDCLVVRRDEADELSVAIETKMLSDLPSGNVLIEVAYSSLNYKDALACQAHPGIVRNLPHVPGIDAAGIVIDSSEDDFRPGDSVLVTGYDLGTTHWGGYSRFVRVPAEWIVATPEGIDAKTAMTYGTAGFTAAQCVSALLQHGVQASAGPIVVTGASGGVGSLSIAILSKLGYEVVAASGKPHLESSLLKLGAVQVIGRDEVHDSSDRPLLSSRWAGAIDTVGGNTLSTLLRSTKHRGCIAACGLAGGSDLPMTVHPFILRGVTLAGIDSAKCPRDNRLQIWQRLADSWKVEGLDAVTRVVTLADVAREAQAMLAGETFGRTLVQLTD